MLEDGSHFSFHLSERRRIVVYIPWLSLISFALVLTGTIAWSVGASSALDNTGRMLSTIKVDIQEYIRIAQNISVFAVACCCVLAFVMLAMSCGRSCTERAVDLRGQATRGAAYWMGFSAFLTVLWWIVLFLLMFVFFVSAAWFGVTFSSAGILRLSAKTAQNALVKVQRVQASAQQGLLNSLGGLSATSGGSPLPPGSPPDDALLAGLDALLSSDPGSPQAAAFGAPPPPYVPVDSDNATSCPSQCLNLAVLEYFLGREVCICTVNALQRALGYAEAAHRGTTAVLAGAFLLWAGASFLLMNAAAEFAKAKRERALLLRAHRRYVASAAAAAAPGGASAPGGAAAAAGGGGQTGAGITLDVASSSPLSPLFQYQPSLQGGLLSPQAQGSMALGDRGGIGGGGVSPSGLNVSRELTYSYTAGSAAGGGTYGDMEPDDVPLLLKQDLHGQGPWAGASAEVGTRSRGAGFQDYGQGVARFQSEVVVLAEQGAPGDGGRPAMYG